MSPTTKPGAQDKASETQQSQQTIHPLFAKERFGDDIDWEKAFRIPAVLATRLIDTPQALHWGFALLFGLNEPAALPEGVKSTADGGDINEIPVKYACNKGVGQLSDEDIAAVRQHFMTLAGNVQYETCSFDKPGALGRCIPLSEDLLVNNSHGCPSLIQISTELYTATLARDARDLEDAAAMDMKLALVMVHEVAHALGYANNGPREVEDFFETSHIAEYGWELVSRIFGMCPMLNLKPALSYWRTWQNVEHMVGGYDLSLLCRNAWKLPKTAKAYGMRLSFAVELLSDRFWEEDYVQEGAFALIPPWVEYLCLSGKDNNDIRGIPQSIRDLYRENAKSYAEKKYARFANPGRVLRGGEPGPWWLEGEGHDALEYQAEEPQSIDRYEFREYEPMSKSELSKLQAECRAFAGEDWEARFGSFREQDTKDADPVMDDGDDSTAVLDTSTAQSKIEVAAKVPTKGRDPPSIHPIFAKSQFADNIKWTKAFRESSVLATRLLDSPQALHFMYAFFYGKNTDTALPEDYFTREDHTFVPFEFACNKSITQLSTEDIGAVRQHLVDAAQYIRFEVAFGGDPNIDGQAERVKRSSEDDPHDSCIIRISEKLYDHAMARRTKDTESAATIDFAVAIAMLHELAHALHIIYMGPRDVEDFFEDSLVAELGFEFESRLFGLCAMVRPENLRNSDWKMRQTQLFLEDNFRLSYCCRDESKLPTTSSSHHFSPGWAADLAENSFWDEYDESVRERALTLIPDCVVNRVRRGSTSGIPKSIQELIRTEEPKSYAEEQYGHLANPDRVPRPHSLRRIDMIDNDEVDQEGSESEESAWLEGEGNDNLQCVDEDIPDMIDVLDENGTDLDEEDGLMTEDEDVEMTDIEG